MKTLKLCLAAMLVATALAGAAMRSAAGDEGTGPGKHAPRDPAVAKVVKRTDEFLIRAHAAARKGGEEKGELRTAWVRQRAARAAIRNDRLPLAVRLSLSARALARKVIEANKEKLTDEEKKDDPADQKLAEGATDNEADAAAKEADAKTPSADDLLKADPKPDDEKGEHSKDKK